MFIYILLAVLCAKLKGYKLIPVTRAYSLYPYAVVEVMYLFLQFNIFIRNYSFLKFTTVINMIYLYTLIIPIIVYKLYKPGIYGSILIVVGTLLNKFVISQNDGKMPVFASLSKLTGYYDETAILTVDKIHSIGNEATRFKFLTDFIDIGCSILSIGDLLIHSFVFIVIYNVIKEINKGNELVEESRKGSFLWKQSR
ncbi:MAG: hypothetical protein K0S47_2747 [Herbinix sp.]|jgi:hypothetical protein|nr:hypothetical protein [Herbinix sp.]